MRNPRHLRHLRYLVLLIGLLAGCISTGQGPSGLEESASRPSADLEEKGGAGRAAPLSLPSSQLAAPLPGGSAVLSAYDPSQNGYTIQLLDPATGELVPDRAPVLVGRGRGYPPNVAYSRDGKRLAAIESAGDSCEAYAEGTSCYPKATVLHLLELSSWQVTATALPSDGWAGAMAFSPEGDRLAIPFNQPEKNAVLIFAASSGELLASLALDFRSKGVAFYQDSSRLLAYGSLPGEDPGVGMPGPLRLEAYSIPSGEKLWGDEFPGVISGAWCLEGCDSGHGRQLYADLSPGYVLSPDGGEFYIFHAHEDRFTRISLADGSREVVEIHEARSWIERFLASTAGVAQAKGGLRGAKLLAAISPDGERLYVQSTAIDSELNADGYWVPTESVNELRIIEAKSGQILAKAQAPGYGASLTADGETLFFTRWTDSGLETEVRSATDLHMVEAAAGWELIHSTDQAGNAVLLGRREKGSTTELALIDPVRLQVERSWSTKGPANWIPAP